MRFLLPCFLIYYNVYTDVFLSYLHSIIILLEIPLLAIFVFAGSVAKVVLNSRDQLVISSCIEGVFGRHDF